MSFLEIIQIMTFLCYIATIGIIICLIIILWPIIIMVNKMILFVIISNFFGKKKLEKEFSVWEEERKQDIEQYGDIMCLHEGGFSLNHKNESGKNMYCFSSYLATMDVMDSFEIILFVMEELLKSFMVINEINSSETPYCHYKKKKKCYKFNSFLQNYFIFYKAYNIGDIAFINENKKMYTVTRGMDVTIFKAIKDFDYYLGNHNINFYGYFEYKFNEYSFEIIKNSIANGEYDIFLSYNMNHEYLLFRINPEKVNISDIVETIKSACEKHGKKLEINL